MSDAATADAPKGAGGPANDDSVESISDHSGLSTGTYSLWSGRETSAHTNDPTSSVGGGGGSEKADLTSGTPTLPAAPAAAAPWDQRERARPLPLPDPPTRPATATADPDVPSAADATAAYRRKMQLRDRGDSLYISIGDVWMPTWSQYWLQTTLLFDKDMDDDGNQQLLTSHRSEEYMAPPIQPPPAAGAPRVPQPRLALNCMFSLKPRALASLRLRDLRLLVEVIAVDPGDGSMAKVASDVCTIAIDSASGEVKRGTKARKLVGAFSGTSLQLALGSYRVTFSPEPVSELEYDYHQPPAWQPPEFSIDRLPTTIPEEGSFVHSDSMVSQDTLETQDDDVRPQACTVECNLKAITDWHGGNSGGGDGYGSSGAAPPAAAVRITSRFSDRVLARSEPSPIKRSNAAAWRPAAEWVRCLLEPEDVRESDTVGFEIVDVATATAATAERHPAHPDAVAWFPLPFSLFAPYHQYFFELVNTPRTGSAVTTTPRAPRQEPTRMYAAVRVIPSNPMVVMAQAEVLEVRLVNARGSGLCVVGQWAENVAKYPDDRAAATLVSHVALRTLSVPGICASQLQPVAFGGVRGRPESDIQLLAAPPLSEGAQTTGGQHMYFTAKSYVLYSGTAGLVFEVFRGNSWSEGHASVAGMGREASFIAQATTDAVDTGLLPSGEDLVATASLLLNDATRASLQSGEAVYIALQWRAADAKAEWGKVQLQVQRVNTTIPREKTVVFSDVRIDGSTPIKSPRTSVHNAATTIQSSFRGYRARKSLKGLSSPTLEKISPSAAFTFDLSPPRSTPPPKLDLGSPASRTATKSMAPDDPMGVLGAEPSAQWTLFEAPQALLEMTPAVQSRGGAPSILQKVFPDTKGGVKVNQGQFEAIISNLEHHQALVTRLQSQIDVSSNTIRDQVKDLVQLRESVATVRAEGADLTRQLTQHKEALRATMVKEGVQTLPRHALVEAYALVAQKFKQEQLRETEYRTRVQRLQNARIELNDTEKEYLKLQREHLRVCAEVQRLQGRETRRKSIAAATQQQGEIILRLEALIVSSGTRIDPATSMRSEEYRTLLATNCSLLSEYAKAKKEAGGSIGAVEALAQYVDPYNRVDREHKELLEKLRGEVAELLSANTKLAAENGTMRAEQLTHEDQDLHWHLVDARAREREGTLQTAIDTETRRHNARMRELREQYSELTMSITGAQRAIQKAANVSSGGGHGLARRLGSGHRKERSIELSDPPDLGLGPLSPASRDTNVFIDSQARPMSPRTRELREYAKAIKELHKDPN